MRLGRIAWGAFGLYHISLARCELHQSMIWGSGGSV